MVPER